jgi:plasmid stabilization system protein ParE
MANVVWTAEAQVWLRDIYDYIAADNPAAAERVVFAIHASVQALQEQAQWPSWRIRANRWSAPNMRGAC